MCGQPYPTGAILVESRLRPALGPITVCGCGLCPDHDHYNKGYVALIECDPRLRPEIPPDVRAKTLPAYRVGRIAYVKQDTFDNLFRASPPVILPALLVKTGTVGVLRAALDID